jgi:hypothetical protein
MTAELIDFDLDASDRPVVTIADAVNGDGGYIRERDGSQQYARIRLTVAAHRDGPSSYRFECRDKALTPLMVAAVLDGIKTALTETFSAGHPVGLVSVAVIEGSTNTTANAISLAACMAVKDALRRARFVKPQ